MLEWRSVSDSVKTVLDLLWLGKTVPVVLVHIHCEKRPLWLLIQRTKNVSLVYLKKKKKKKKKIYACQFFFFFFFLMYDWLTTWLPLFLWRLTENSVLLLTVFVLAAVDCCFHPFPHPNQPTVITVIQMFVCLVWFCSFALFYLFLFFMYSFY